MKSRIGRDQGPTGEIPSFIAYELLHLPPSLHIVRCPYSSSGGSARFARGTPSPSSDSMANRGSPDHSVRSPSPEIPESDDIVQTEETSAPSFTSSSAGHAAAHLPTAGEDDEEEVPSEEDGVRDWVQRKVRFRDRTQLKRIKQDMWNENKAFQYPVSIGDGTVNLKSMIERYWRWSTRKSKATSIYRTA